MTMAIRKIENVKKIAVLRANALGDFIFILPALEALRITYPEAEIVLLGKSWHVAFLQNRPGPVDRVLIVPPCKGVSENDQYEMTPQDEAALQQFFEQAQAEHFDLALQLHGGGRFSNPFILNLKAKFTAGLGTPDAAALDRTIPYIYFQHEILRYLEVARIVGATTAQIEPHLIVTPVDLAESYRIVPETGRPLVALHPGATANRRRWSPANFAQLAQNLLDVGLQVVVTGTPPEQKLVEDFFAALPQEKQVQNLCGALSLNGLTGLLSRCALVISNDSGPLHLGAAVGAATVGIYWCGNMINAGHFYRAHHRPTISWRLECPVCGTNTISGFCNHEVSFVDDITPAEVTEQALALLKEQ